METIQITSPVHQSLSNIASQAANESQPETIESKFLSSFFSENIYFGEYNTNVVHINILATLTRAIPLEHRNTLQTIVSMID